MRPRTPTDGRVLHIPPRPTPRIDRDGKGTDQQAASGCAKKQPGSPGPRRSEPVRAEGSSARRGPHIPTPLTVRLGSAPGTSRRSIPALRGRCVEGAFAALTVATALTHSSVRCSRTSKGPVSCMTTARPSAIHRTTKSLGRNRTARSSFLATLYALSLAAQRVHRSSWAEAEALRASRSSEVKTRVSNLL